MSRFQSHEKLEVYDLAFKAAMKIYEASKKFPREEVHSLTDQIRGSSRSVCSSLAEAWRKRRYEAVFVSKLNDAELEAGATKTWVRFAIECGCFSKELGQELYQTYDHIIGKLVHMIINPSPWILRKTH